MDRIARFLVHVGVHGVRCLLEIPSFFTYPVLRTLDQQCYCVNCRWATLVPLGDSLNVSELLRTERRPQGPFFHVYNI